MADPRTAGARRQGLRTWSPAADEQGATRLILDGNRLRQLPDSIGSLTLLEVLDLAGNALTTLPAAREPRRVPALADTPQLDKLDLRWNALRDDLPVIRRLRDRGCLVHV